MSEDLLKKKNKLKRSLEKGGLTKTKSRFQTLGHIVLSNGSVVEIPKLPTSSSALTSYDHMRIALEYAALATSCLNQLDLVWDPKKTNQFLITLESFQMNMEDLMNHIYYAIEGFPKHKE